MAFILEFATPSTFSEVWWSRGSFSTSTSHALYGFSLRSSHCRFIEHARKKKSFRQDSVTNTSNINRAHGSNTLPFRLLLMGVKCSAMKQFAPLVVLLAA